MRDPAGPGLVVLILLPILPRELGSRDQISVVLACFCKGSNLSYR